MANEPELREGSTDADTNGYVTYLQQCLGGYYTGQIDGWFGPITDAAVKQYQSDNGLDADGVVNEATWAKLTGEAGTGESEGGETEGGEGQEPQVDWGSLPYLSSLMNSQPQDESSTRLALGVEADQDDDTAFA